MTALVTGAGKRLGRAMALTLADMGHDIAVHYHSSDEAAKEVVQAVRDKGCDAAAIQADLTNWDETATLVDRATQALDGPLTVLVNNASIFEHDTIGTVTQDSWDAHMTSNLRAPLQLIQAFAAQAPEARTDANGEPQAQAAVINMLDQRVRKLTPHFTTYTLAKMGLWALTQTAAQGLAPHVRVNAIGPGPTLKGARQSEEHFADQRAATILERGSDPEGICDALRYLLTARAVTGQLICVDGGQHLAWKTPDVASSE